MACIILLLLFNFACAHLTFNFTASGAENPDTPAAQKLSEILNDEIFYPREYERGVFDCSNESALLHDFLEKKGYDCEIVSGLKLEKDDIDLHAWLIARKDGKIFLIEATTKRIVSCHYYKNYLILLRCRSLKFLKFLSSIIGLNSDWAY